VSIETIREIVQHYVTSKRKLVKYCNLVERPKSRKMLLSEWAQFFGATYEIRDTSRLDEPYISSTPISF